MHITENLYLRIAELEAQLAERAAEVEWSRYTLKRVGGLHTLGYNERHAEDQPNQTDETGTTLVQYRKASRRLFASIRLSKRKVTLALAAGLDQREEAPHA
jgi:hypothetical protein